MRGPGSGKNSKSKVEGAQSEDLPAEPESCATVKNVSRGKKRGPRRGRTPSDKKVYLGVRVKMTVRDMLQNIRIAQGWGPEQLQDAFKRKEERVKTRTGHKAVKKRSMPKGLEELTIIVEVLEEDLKTPTTNCSSPPRLCEPPASPEYTPALTGYTSDSSEDIPSPQSYMSYSPQTDFYQAQSPDYYQAQSPEHMTCTSPAPEELYSPQMWSLDSSAFFWTQLQREEGVLNNMCDAELLSTDEHGRNLLHKVVCVGKRALAYAIAKRMAAINSLDLKDSHGMTALHYAAKNNHHLTVCDLIHLGANINERNNMGKSCLHLSAEKGYTQVLEVLKQFMMDGYFVDVEATDNSGMSVLQCAAVALKDTLSDEDSSSTIGSKVYSLRKEQMLETLECVLQMGSHLHSVGSWGMPLSS